MKLLIWMKTQVSHFNWWSLERRNTRRSNLKRAEDSRWVLLAVRLVSLLFWLSLCSGFLLLLWRVLCWIFVCWLHFCLKNIFTLDVEHNVPTSRHGSVCFVPCLILRTCLFCLRNLRIHQCWSTCVSLSENQNICDFLRKW